jgi:hypothetical protein
MTNKELEQIKANLKNTAESYLTAGASNNSTYERITEIIEEEYSDIPSYLLNASMIVENK